MVSVLLKATRMAVAILLLTTLSACVTYEYHETRSNHLSKADPNAAEQLDSRVYNQSLLDVGVVLLGDGVDLLDDDSVAYANVRRSEAVWFTEQLKQTIDNSNAWGLVRTLPNNNIVFDLIVEGTIIDSTGEDLALQIKAYDSTGVQWLSKDYFEKVSQYAYNPEITLNRDPFQNIFNEIANDLFELRSQRDNTKLLTIREVSKLRFAKEFAPQVFDSFVHLGDGDIYQVHRLPADNDPMIERVEQIRARNDLFLDVLQDYYRVFQNNMSNPYNEWRKISYKDVVYQRQLAKKAQQERIAGLAIVASGVLAATGNNSSATRAAGSVGIGVGASLFQESYGTADEASLHAEALREYGESLEVELEPSVIDLRERSVTLTGTVEDQFKEWKRILQEMFDAEQAILNPDIDTFKVEGSQSKLETNDVIKASELAQKK